MRYTLSTRQLVLCSWFVILAVRRICSASCFSPLSSSFPVSKGKRHRNNKNDIIVNNMSASSSPLPLPTPLEDHHKPRPTPFKTFATTALAVPIVSVTVLPITLIYQLGRRILSSSSSSDTKKNNSSSIKLDSGYQVDPTQIIPLEKRTYDVVVLGATGFTGGLAVRYLAERYGVNNKDVKWAIAGRSQKKLDAVKEQLAQELGNDEIKNVDTIIVDTAVPATLPALVSQTRCVATTAGPFALYGTHVVEFCAKFGTHYADITGEVGWAKAMFVQWQEMAQKSGARLVSFCGHDSIPWDLSVSKMQEALKKETGDDLKSVTFWDELKGAAPGGTVATVLNAIEGAPVEAPRSEFDPYLRLPNGKKSDYNCKVQNPSFIGRADWPWESESAVARWTCPFIMAAVNGQVVRRSHALRATGSPSLTYSEMQICPDFQGAFVSFFGLAIMGTLMANPLTLPLMKKYVLPKPGDGPSMKSMLNKHYLCVYGEGIGVNGNRVESTMYFPRDVGCLETSKMLVESALCLAKDDLQVGGGFWTPSTGMGQHLLDRLVGFGTKFATRVILKEETRAKL